MTVIEWLQIFSANVWILFLMIVAASGTGALLLDRFEFETGLERVLFSALTGMGTCGLVVFALGISGALYRPALIGLTVAGVGIAVFQAFRAYRRAAPGSLKNIGRVPGKRKALAVAIGLAAFAYWTLLILPTQYPPHHWDATSNHLLLVREYLSNHRIIAHEGISVPVLASLNHMLFAWGFALKDDTVTQMLSHAFMIMIALGLYCWGKSEASGAVGLAAAFIWLGHPLVLWLGESAYVDIGVTAFAFFGIYALRKFWLTRTAGWWYLGMALLGFSAGVKLTGLVFIAIGGLVGAFASFKRALPASALIRGGLLALALAAPVYGFITYHTGNPFWPAVPGLSRGVWGNEWVIGFNQEMYEVGVGKKLWNFFLVPFQILLHPEWFMADNNRPLSPLIVLLPLTWAVAFFSRPVRWCVCWTLMFTVIWFFGSQQVRLWIPVLPVAGLSIAFSVAAVFERVSLPRLARAAAWGALILCSLSYGAAFVVKDLRAWGWPYLGPKGRDYFLSSYYQGYTAAQFINRNGTKDDVVLIINGSWMAYYLRPKALDVQGLLQRSNRPTYRLPEDQEWEARMKALGVEWVMINHLGLPPSLSFPSSSPDWKPPWKIYVLVLETPSTWVFKRVGG